MVSKPSDRFCGCPWGLCKSPRLEARRRLPHRDHRRTELWRCQAGLKSARLDTPRWVVTSGYYFLITGT
jgi:hypothetical protein